MMMMMIETPTIMVIMSVTTTGDFRPVTSGQLGLHGPWSTSDWSVVTIVTTVGITMVGVGATRVLFISFTSNCNRSSCGDHVMGLMMMMMNALWIIILLRDEFLCSESIADLIGANCGCLCEFFEVFWRDGVFNTMSVLSVILQLMNLRWLWESTCTIILFLVRWYDNDDCCHVVSTPFLDCMLGQVLCNQSWMLFG